MESLAFRLPFVVAVATVVACHSSSWLARLLAFQFHIGPFFMMRTLYQLLRPPRRLPPPPPETKQVYLIPSYEEPIAVLRKTLRRLASHMAAREAYVVVLAMEARELVREEGKAKLAMLLEEFGDGSFHTLTHSEHTLLPGEVASSCSNVAAALRFVVSNLGLDSTGATVTKMDADSMLLDEYSRRASSLVMAASEDAPVLAFPSMSFPPMRFEHHSVASWMAASLDAVWQGICLSGAGRPTPVHQAPTAPASP